MEIQFLGANDLALALHLAVLLIFIKCNGCCLYASGKFVPGILKFGLDGIDEDTRRKLNFVLKVVRNGIKNGKMADFEANYETLKSLI